MVVLLAGDTKNYQESGVSQPSVGPVFSNNSSYFIELSSVGVLHIIRTAVHSVINSVARLHIIVLSE